MADDDTEDQPELEGRVSKIEAAVDRIEAAITKVVGGAHKDATATTEDHLDESGSVAAEVQRELARRDAETKRQEHEADLGNLKQAVAELREKPPEPPRRRVEKFMGWH
jgi:hypothetical protein